MSERPKQPPRVLQILPADGWRAVHTSDEGDPWDDPLVCWALVEFLDKDYGPRVDEIYWPAVRAAHQAIVGMTTGIDGMVDAAESSSNFLGYAAPGEDLSCWEAKAKDYAEIVAKRRQEQP